MDDPKFALELLGLSAAVAAFIWRGGEIKAAIEASLRQNDIDHDSMHANQDALWTHERAQDELIAEHGLDIERIKERIKAIRP